MAGEYILILTGGNIRVSNEGESICLEQINPNEDKITIDDEMITVETSLVNSLQEPENKVLSATQFKVSQFIIVKIALSFSSSFSEKLFWIVGNLSCK